MADIAPRLVELSAGKLHSLHQRLHKSELTPEVLEVHHLVINEALRRGLMRVEKDEWDKYEIEVDYLQNVDISKFSESLPEDAVSDLVRKMGSSIGNIRTVLTVNGYELRIETPEPVEEKSFNKMIRHNQDGWTVYDQTGTRKFGTYDSKKEAEDRLEEIHRFSKANDFTPPKGVRVAARRALDWISEGRAGDGFTSVGRLRAQQLSAGENISLATLKRMKAFFSRHEVDKDALGFSQGEKGYPSPGRVAWDAWGGDAGFSWAESQVSEAENALEKHLMGQHDQKTHAPKYAQGIADEIKAGGHPVVAPEDISALFGGMAKLTSHPDITELKVKGTLLFGDEGMGVARSDMPQIPSSKRDKFLADIEKDSGITSTKEKVDPTTLKPIQKEVSGSRAGAIYEKFAEKGKIPKDERILISKDGFVVDGHHTWAASVAFSFDNPGTELPVYRLSVNADEALKVSRDYAKAKGYESKAMSDSAKYGNNGKEIKKSDLLKHGNHDQSTHGNWATGGGGSAIPDRAPDVAPEAGRDPQAVAVATALRNQFIKIEPEITKTMIGLAAKVGGTMDGLQDRIKSTDSLTRKIQDDSMKDGVTFEQAAGQVSDAVRYTMVFSEQDYASAAQRIDAQLRADGFEPRTKNFWKEGDPYQGINIKATKNGVTAELQLHTPKSLEIKKEIHPIYKVESKTADPRTKYKLYMREVRYARRIPFPEDRQLLSTIGVQSFQPFQTPREAGLIKTTGVDIMETIRGE